MARASPTWGPRRPRLQSGIPPVPALNPASPGGREVSPGRRGRCTRPEGQRWADRGGTVDPRVTHAAGTDPSVPACAAKTLREDLDDAAATGRAGRRRPGHEPVGVRRPGRPRARRPRDRGGRRRPRGAVRPLRPGLLRAGPPHPGRRAARAGRRAGGLPHRLAGRLPLRRLPRRLLHLAAVHDPPQGGRQRPARGEPPQAAHHRRGARGHASPTPRGSTTPSGPCCGGSGCGRCSRRCPSRSARP